MTNEMFNKARRAVDQLRDFAREHGMDHRRRDPLVLDIHRAIDAAAVPPSAPAASEPTKCYCYIVGADRDCCPTCSPARVSVEPPDLWQRIYDAAANNGSILHDDTVTAIAEALKAEPPPQWADIRTAAEEFITAAEKYRIHSELLFAEPIEIATAMIKAREVLREALKVAPSQWADIRTAPPLRDEELWFWIRPKTDDEAYTDTSGRPITTVRGKPQLFIGKYKTWNALMMATHWMRPNWPAPPTAERT